MALNTTINRKDTFDKFYTSPVVAKMCFDLFLNKKDVDVLFKKEKFNKKFNSFNEITKKDIKDIVLTLTDLEPGLDADDCVDGCYWRLKNNYPYGLKNIPNILRLFRYLEVKHEYKINKENLGISYVADKKLITPDFINSIFAKGYYGFIVEVETTKDQIDINGTIESNAEYPDECEITLKENAKLKIINIEKYVN